MRLHRRRRTTKRLSVGPFRPEGWGGKALISALFLLDDTKAGTRRHALISEPWRAQHVGRY